MKETKHWYLPLDKHEGWLRKWILEDHKEWRPNGTQKIPTGLSIELEDRNQVALIFARSSMGIKHSVTPANAVGVVDSDYRGEVCVFLHNYSDVEYTVQPQDRVAQMVIMPVLLPEIEEVTELSDTERGEGGFGSTGK